MTNTSTNTNILPSAVASTVRGALEPLHQLQSKLFKNLEHGGSSIRLSSWELSNIDRAIDALMILVVKHDHATEEAVRRGGRPGAQSSGAP